MTAATLVARVKKQRSGGARGVSRRSRGSRGVSLGGVSERDVRGESGWWAKALRPRFSRRATRERPCPNPAPAGPILYREIYGLTRCLNNLPLPLETI